MGKRMNTVEMRVKTTEEMLKLVKRRCRNRSTLTRAGMTMI